MSVLVIFLVMATLQQPEPMQVVFEGRLSEPRPATSWDCNFIDFQGNDLVLTGRFPEAPVGWDPYTEQAVEVKGLAPPHFLGSKRVKFAKSTQEVREYSMTIEGLEGDRYYVHFQFIRDRGSMAKVTHYMPPSGDESGKMTAFANGYCSTKFHDLGEKVGK